MDALNWCIGLEITDYYCNGFFGRDFELEGSIILHAGEDYMVVRKPSRVVLSCYFDGYTFEEVRNLVERWTK